MTKVSIDTDSLRRELDESLNRELDRRAVLLEQCLRNNAPKRSGDLSRSIKVRVEVRNGRLEGAITMGSQHASFVLNGTKHATYFIPPDSGWVRSCVNRILGGLNGTKF